MDVLLPLRDTVLARRGSIVTAVFVCVTLLTACGAQEAGDATGSATTAPTDPATTTDTDQDASPAASQFVGTIGGDPQLEGGCLWLDTADQRYEIRLPEEFEVDRQGITITAPDGATFTSGDDVAVTGTVIEDMVTVCQVGPLLDVSELESGVS